MAAAKWVEITESEKARSRLRQDRPWSLLLTKLEKG